MSETDIVRTVDLTQWECERLFNFTLKKAAESSKTGPAREKWKTLALKVVPSAKKNQADESAR